VRSDEGETRVDVMATDAQLREEIDPEAATRAQQELAGRDDEESQQTLARATARVNLRSSDRL
jgi:hypothetical protein